MRSKERGEHEGYVRFLIAMPFFFMIWSSTSRHDINEFKAVIRMKHKGIETD